MANEILKELKAEADKLGVSYPNNITVEKLEKLINDFEAEKTKPELKKEEDEPTKKVKGYDQYKKALDKRIEAEKTQYVVITSNDPRDQDDDTVFLGFGNKYFELSRLVPLGQEIWLEKALVDIAKTTTSLQHVNETDRNGRTTGNKTSKLVNRYNVSFPKGEDYSEE